MTEAKRAAVAASVVMGIFGYQKMREAVEERENVRWVIERLNEWNAPGAAENRADLQEQIEKRLSLITQPRDLLGALPAEYVDTFAATEALQKWWEGDRAGALEWMGRQANPPEFQMRRFLTELVDEPEGVSRYLQGSRPGPARDKIIMALAKLEIDTKRPQAAIALLHAMAGSTGSGRLLALAAFEWSQWDFESAANWYTGLPQDSQEETLQALAMGCASHDAKEALEWLGQSKQPKEMVDAATVEVVKRCAQEYSATDAGAWVAHLAPGDRRSRDLTVLISVWKESDFGAVNQWIATLPPGEFRDEARRNLSAAMSGSPTDVNSPPL